MAPAPTNLKTYQFKPAHLPPTNQVTSTYCKYHPPPYLTPNVAPSRIPTIKATSPPRTLQLITTYIYKKIWHSRDAE